MSDDSFCHTKGDSLESVEGLVCNSSRGMKRNFKNLKNEIKKKNKILLLPLLLSSHLFPQKKWRGEKQKHQQHFQKFTGRRAHRTSFSQHGCNQGKCSGGRTNGKNRHCSLRNVYSREPWYIKPNAEWTSPAPPSQQQSWTINRRCQRRPCGCKYSTNVWMAWGTLVISIALH